MTRLGLAIACMIVWLVPAAMVFAQAGPAPAPANDPGAKAPPPADARRAAEIEASIRAFWANKVRHEDAIPDGLKGAAAAVPFGDKDSPLKAALYVPATYSPGRTWPLLIESASKGAAPFHLAGFLGLAEKHETLFLVVEYSFPEGRAVDQQSGWTRQGTQEFTSFQTNIEEMLAKMAADEKTLQALLKQVSAKYNVEPKAVGTTGFLWPGLMAYRLALSYPNQFCCCIGRAASFEERCMPKDVAKARNTPFYIISGEREPAWAAENAARAVEFLKKRQFSKVVVEKIPNSGVDARPEITTNYFRAAVEESLGQEQMTFYRVYSKALRCAEGLPAAGDVAAAGRPVAGQAQPKDAPPAKAPAATPAAPAPPTVDEAMASIKAFNEQYPRSEFRPALEFISARIVFEKQNDRAKADEMLRAFLRPPLRDKPVAVPAIFYLAEKVIDRTTAAQDAATVLGAIISRRGSSPNDVKRATELRKEFQGAKPQ